MFQNYRKLLGLLDRRDKRRFYLLFAMMIISGVIEIFTIVSMFPFLAVVAKPEMLEKHEKLVAVYHYFGFQSTQAFLAFAGATVFLIIFFGLLFATLTQYAIYRYTAMCGYRIGGRVLRGYLSQPYSWFLGKHSADLGATVLTEVNEVIQRSMLPAMKMIAQAAVAIFMVIMLVGVQPFAALIAAVVLGGSYILVFALVRRKISHMGRVRKQANIQKYKVAGEAFGGIKDVKLLGIEGAFLRRYERASYRAAEASALMGVAGEAPRNILRAIALGGILAFVVVLLIRDGNVTDVLPILGLYAFAGIRLLPALQVIYQSMTMIRFTQPMLDKVHRDLTRNLPQGEASVFPPPAEPLPLRRRLELRGVRYTYPAAERGALNGLDMVIPARETVGIVGGTGAGKTTAVDVLLGLLRPQEGALVVDDETVDDALVRRWQRSVGYVPQQIFLMDESVAMNIAFGVEPKAIDMAAVERAARIAELHDFILSDLPQGYETLLGERGIRLSGGQRQRIGIARALYHDPEVLVLDEATSALDNLTERAVMDAVHNLGGKKTIIMIAHRLSTVQDCSRIFLLEQGRVAAEGSYGDLVETNDQFRRLASGGR